jgi:hypothetical protein
MNIEYILPLVTFWHTISSQIAKYNSPEITNNAVSFIHCLSYIAHYHYDYNLNYAIHISIGFYMYDLFFIMQRVYHQDSSKRKDEIKKQVPFIIHHIAGSYLLYSALTDKGGDSILGAFLILEKSNIMIYVSYYLHKQRAEYVRLCAVSECAQLITYTYYRLFALSVFIYEHSIPFFNYPFITQFLIILVYLMGYAWSYRLLKKNVRNFYRVAALSKKYSSAG